MSNMLSSGLAWLNEVIAEHASAAVTFHRGGQSVAVDAIVRKPIAPPITTAGPPINPNTAERDFSVLLSDLASVLGTAMPATADYFTEILGGQVRVFKVSSPMIGGPWWEWATGDRGPNARITIHAKQTAVFTGTGSLALRAQTVAGSGV